MVLLKFKNQLFVASLLSAAYVNLSFFIAISRCCETLDRITDWAAKPAAYLVRLIPYKTQGQFWLLFFVMQFLVYAIVVLVGLNLSARILAKKSNPR